MEKYLIKQKEVVDKYLDKYLPGEKDYPSIIHEAMRYSVLSGGKRFRPILTLACAEACGGNFEDVISSACALEIIHAYSLIHDDLPAMDNDDYRRGKLSNHKKFGEDIAILAGDALLTKAFELMDPRVVKDVARAIGSKGVVGGQVVDMQLAKKEFELNLPIMEYIHTHKTGALIAVACKVGAIISNVPEKTINAINIYGENIGFAFQIIDDIFDNENYAVLLGEKEAMKSALSFVKKAKDELALHFSPEKSKNLFALADFVASRKE